MLRLDIFNTYWNILKNNYKDTQHNDKEYKIYYSIFKEYENDDFIKAIKMVLKYQSFFPRIDEIVKYLPQIDKIPGSKLVPEWFDKDLKIEKLSEKEERELEKILREL